MPGQLHSILAPFLVQLVGPLTRGIGRVGRLGLFLDAAQPDEKSPATGPRMPNLIQDRPPRKIDADERQDDLLTALLAEGADRLLANAGGAELRAVDVAGVRVPLAVCPDTSPRASILQPTAHYLDYPSIEIAKVSSFWTESRLKLATQPLRQLFKIGGIDRVAYLNHWLTTAAPPIRASTAELRRSFAEIAGDYPGHAVVIPNVVPALHGDYPNRLEAAGCLLIPSRVVWIYDPAKSRLGSAFQNRRHSMNKARRARESLAPGMVGRKELCRRLDEVHRLYRELYIDRYSRLNPQYTETFFARLIESPAIEATGWVDPDDRLEMFSLDRTVEGAMVWSVKGHSLEAVRPRRLNGACFGHYIVRADAEGGPSNWGGGSGQFKRQRGAEPAQEFDAVYLRHLKKGRRMPWQILRRLRRVKASLSLSA